SLRVPASIFLSWPYCMFAHFFFFSSRRRHTRFSRDWSSDVCSSDLHLVARGVPGADAGLQAADAGLPARAPAPSPAPLAPQAPPGSGTVRADPVRYPDGGAVRGRLRLPEVPLPHLRRRDGLPVRQPPS